MALFLEVHQLEGRDPGTFLATCSTMNGDDISCLRHWVDGDAIALLTEAPDEESLRARGLDAVEVTQLFAPASRWATTDALDFPKMGGSASSLPTG
jgi:hypothetical protein